MLVDGHPVPIGWLEVRTVDPSDGGFLWILEFQGQNADEAARGIEYGIVPPGYKQNVPSAHVPPLLREGREYELLCDASEGRFRIDQEGVHNVAVR